MPNEYNRNLIPRAKEMRENMTPQEQQLDLLVLRFTNDEIDHLFDSVRNSIDQAVKERLYVSSGCPPWGADARRLPQETVSIEGVSAERLNALHAAQTILH